MQSANWEGEAVKDTDTDAESETEIKLPAHASPIEIRNVHFLVQRQLLLLGEFANSFLARKMSKLSNGKWEIFERIEICNSRIAKAYKIAIGGNSVVYKS